MENNEKKLVWELSNTLHGSLNGENVGTFIYEICFLRLVSLRTFENLAHMNHITLEKFINEYKVRINDLIMDDIKEKKNKELIIECINDILEDIERLKYSIKDMNPILCILCSYNDIVIQNVMTMDIMGKSARYSGIEQTPNQICNIVNTLLDIDKNEDVLDICSGYGNYLVNVNCKYDYNSLTGIEINHTSSLLNKIRLVLSSNNFEILNRDIFEIDFSKKYDKIFCNYPFGLRMEKHYFDFVLQRMNYMKFNWSKINNSSIDWLFVNILLTMLKDNGKGAIIMPAGPLFKVADEEYRKTLVDNGFIEKVIKLPVITNYTGIEQYLLVLSKNNKKIKFIDISTQKEKTISGTTEVCMNKVFDILDSNDSKYVVEIDNESIAENSYLLRIENYVNKKEIKYYNPQKLSDFVVDVFRGYQMTSTEQKELEDENGDYEVLTISDIDNGMISNELLKIDGKDNKYERYLVKENDLIISSKGTRIKIAVVRNIEERKIIANGNLIVLRIDKTKLNPYYLEAYLNSSVGKTILEQIQTGAVIISINPNKLIEIKISMLPFEKQNEVAEKYLIKKKQLLLAKEHLKQIEEEHNDYFDNEVMEMFENGK